MIIVHVHHTFYPVIGGLERVVQRIAEEQARLGHEVHVVTSWYGAHNRPREEISNNVYIHRIKAWRPGYPDLTIPREFPGVLLKRAEVVHVHSQNSLFNIKIAGRAKRYGVKIAVYFMAIDALFTHTNLLKRILGSTYQRMLVYKALGIADLRLVKSLRDKRILIEKYYVDALYVPDGIDEEYLKKPRNPDKFRKRFSIKEDELVFLYVGRLHPAKGPQVLIRAAEYLRKEIKNFKIVIIGPGPQAWLWRLIKKLNLQRNVILTGPLPEELKISAMDASTAVVVPSLYDYVEVFSLVVCEAWARGKPVIASRVGELAYRIKPGVNGVLIQPGSPKALAKAIIEIAQNPFNTPKVRLMTWNDVAKKLCIAYSAILPRY